MSTQYDLKKASYLNENLPDPSPLNAGVGTISIASPAVVTITNHGLITGQRVYIATNGSLPTGLEMDQEYFVIKLTNNTFNLSLSNISYTPINTSGTQSGIHTFFRVGYYIRFRIVSEDKGQYSHWSPVYFVEDPYAEQIVYSIIDGGTSTSGGGV